MHNSNHWLAKCSLYERKIQGDAGINVTFLYIRTHTYIYIVCVYMYVCIMCVYVCMYVCMNIKYNPSCRV